MCELTVIIDNETVFENAIFAKIVENNVVVKDIIGKTMEFKNYSIDEVNITKEQLILSSK